MTQRTTRAAIAFALSALLASPALAGVTPRQFSAGSLIIPMDNCWQGDIAQPTPSYEEQNNTTTWSNGLCAKSGSGSSNSIYGDGVRRSYGLMWHLLQAGVPLYWIINSTKTNVDDADLTIDASACTGNTEVARLVDQSLPASACGLDQLNPKDIPAPIYGQVPGACSANQAAAGGVAAGTFSLGASIKPSLVSYRGGPFVIDAKDAPLARDVMAWYFSPPVATGTAPYSNPLSGRYTLPSLGTGLGAGMAPYNIDPGHHPLHWSQYAPSALVPLYPPFLFSSSQIDIGTHSAFWPCQAESSGFWCNYTTWDPVSASGQVDPYAAIASGNPDLNTISYATVNVHQAQVDFTANVGQLIDQPMPVIALAALTDPVHMNTFRFYLEEAGLMFGPCPALPGGALWTSPSGGGFPSGASYPALGSNDLFFDVANYPFPDNLGSTFVSPYSKRLAQCSEGIVSNDPTLLTFDAPNTGGAFGAPPVGPVSTAAAPFGQVLDIIAPEVGAFQSLLQPTTSGFGCGAPRYSQLWIPHWDATIYSGPLTYVPSTTATDTLSGSESSGGNCPAQADELALGDTFGASTGPLGVPYDTLLSSLYVAGECQYNPQLVQTVLQDLPVYVAHGGNLLAECAGAASLEDATIGRYLQGAYNIGQNFPPGVLNPLAPGGQSYPPFGLATSSTHFMTEGQGNITAFWPDDSYDVLNPTNTVLTQAMQTPLSTPTPSLTSTCMVGSGDVRLEPATYFVSDPTATQPTKPLPQIKDVGYPGGAIAWPAAPPPIAVTGTSCPANFPAASCQVNYDGGIAPDSDQYRIIEYAPLLSNGGNSSQATLTDPFLQVGDFYFLGTAGLTESFVESANTGYGGVTHAPPGPRLPNTDGYAYGLNYQDTQVLIRGLPSTSGLTVDNNPAWLRADGVGLGAGNSVTENVLGDYWIRNRNSQTPGSGTVVYLAGDSFDGRPDGLRMVWASILNLSFVPSDVEIARSSPSGYTDGGQAFVVQGTFTQSNVDYGRYTPIFTKAADAPTWVFPPERGHLRQYDLNALQATGALHCFNGDGTFNAANCRSTVTGAGALPAVQGSNAVGFGQFTNFSSAFWDTSENVFGSPTVSLLTDNTFPPATQTVGSSFPRAIFSHLYAPVGGTAIGLKSVWLDPSSLSVTNLVCALFPEGCGAVGGFGDVAYPFGGAGAGAPNAIHGPLQCNSCQVASDTATNAALLAPHSVSDVQALLSAVERASGGCTPLLQDTCAPVGSKPVKCLDQCWSSCLSTCEPAVAGSFSQNYPPFSTGCQTCALNCADSCNPTAGCSSGGSCCGVGSVGSQTAQSFREACFPSIGGIDHSTPVIVAGSPSANIASLEDGRVAFQTYSDCRPTVAYVGGGDGMLHAIFVQQPTSSPQEAPGVACNPLPASCNFKPGQELWAFVPNQQLPLIHTGGNCVHSLFVDGVPVVKDVYANFSTSPIAAPTWHTVLTETMGQGGNHVFALDVTDPLAPIHSGGGCAISDATISAAPIVLWEQGDPLDNNDPKPYFAAGVQTWPTSVPSAVAQFFDSPLEGPGYKTSGLPAPTGTVYNHYLGSASSVFMGTLLGSGAQEAVTYVAGQSGGGTPSDAYGRAITLPTCGTACNPKDFSYGGGSTDTSVVHGKGGAGEVVYAFDSATGVVRSSPDPTLGNVVQHFASLYSTASGRSAGFNNIPAPALGVSTSSKPETDLLLIPDLDGQIWALRPATLGSQENGPISAPIPGTPFPFFDVQKFGAGLIGLTKAETGPVVSGALATTLHYQAAFGNPGAILAPGTCAAQGTDTGVVFATGGVDWGPTASLISVVDANIDDLQNPKSVASAVLNDGWAELLPNQGTSPQGIEIPTCETALLPACVGRVFGQPLVVGGTVLYSTSTGLLTGAGASLDQQNGSGTISALGSGSCNAAGVATGNLANCGVCTASASSDVASNVGKVASGLAAVSGAGATGQTSVLSASTTGLNEIMATATALAQNVIQHLALQQWWIRPQRPVSCESAGGTCE